MTKLDHYQEEHGVKFAGKHLIVDFYGATNLLDAEFIEEALVEAAKEAGATVLHVFSHVFDENGGISAVVVLSESHISVHTWPETRYAAFDVFMCGAADPKKALAVLMHRFNPTVTKHQTIYRGVVGRDRYVTE